MGCTLSGLGPKSAGNMSDINVQELEDIANKLRVLSIKSTDAAGSG